MRDIPAESGNPGRSAKKDLRKNVFITNAAHSQLNKATKNLPISNGEYASAAIEYFALSGLDPTAAQTKGLVAIGAKVGEASYEIRKQGAEIGNRIVAIQRVFERELFKFLQAQQTGIVGYLERIETNILDHQVAVESQMLAPMMERLVRTGIDSHITRVLTEILMLKTKTSAFVKEELQESTRDYDAQRERRLVSEIRKLLETATLATPKISVRPQLTAAPEPPKKVKPAAENSSAQPKS
ncbi:hypothetical protein A0257_22735 (plasmid) [Hymenobacter psoromatis]|nr:hypothetical protein A0257_22735 [Hymenobacter psoromatis]